MSECTRYADDLKALVDNELPISRRWAVERHVVRCGNCREEVASMRQIAEGLRVQTPEPLDPALRARILAAIPEPATLSRRPMPRRLSLTLASAIAMAALVLFIFRPGTEQFMNQVPQPAFKTEESGTASSGPASPSAPTPGSNAQLMKRKSQETSSSKGLTGGQAKAPYYDKGLKSARSRASGRPVAVPLARTDNVQEPENRPAYQHKAPAKSSVADVYESLGSKAKEMSTNSEDKKSVAAYRFEGLADLPQLRDSRLGKASVTNRAAGSKNLPAVGNSTAPIVTAPGGAAGQTRGALQRNSTKSRSANSNQFYSPNVADSGAAASTGGFGRGFGGGGMGGAVSRSNAQSPAQSPRAPGGPEVNLRRSAVTAQGRAGGIGGRMGTQLDLSLPKSAILGLTVTDIPQKRAAIDQIAKDVNGLVTDVNGLVTEKKLMESKDGAPTPDAVLSFQVEPARLLGVIDKLEKLGEVTLKLVPAPEVKLEMERAKVEQQTRFRETAGSQAADDKTTRRDGEGAQIQDIQRRLRAEQVPTRFQVGSQVAKRPGTRLLATITVNLKEKKPAALGAAKPAPPPPNKK